LFDFFLGVLFFFCVLGVGVYVIFGAGWASNSKYSFLGRIRSVAQTISYEVVFSLILLVYVLLLGSYDFFEFCYYDVVVLLYFPIFVF